MVGTAESEHFFYCFFIHFSFTVSSPNVSSSLQIFILVVDTKCMGGKMIERLCSLIEREIVFLVHEGEAEDSEEWDFGLACR